MSDTTNTDLLLKVETEINAGVRIRPGTALYRFFAEVGAGSCFLGVIDEIGEKQGIHLISRIFDDIPDGIAFGKIIEMLLTKATDHREPILRWDEELSPHYKETPTDTVKNVIGMCELARAQPEHQILDSVTLLDSTLKQLAECPDPVLNEIVHINRTSYLVFGNRATDAQAYMRSAQKMQNPPHPLPGNRLAMQALVYLGVEGDVELIRRTLASALTAFGTGDECYWDRIATHLISVEADHACGNRTAARKLFKRISRSVRKRRGDHLEIIGEAYQRLCSGSFDWPGQFVDACKLRWGPVAGFSGGLLSSKREMRKKLWG